VSCTLSWLHGPVRRILLFGNSGSGKSTLAKRLCADVGLAHLDLDTLAWLPTTPPQRMPLDRCAADIAAFIDSHAAWVIEGCYIDLLELALPSSSEIIYLDIPVSECITHARKRPWEPHKYPSREAQDANLEMLINWIGDYPHREDTFSQRAHRQFYDRYRGNKTRYETAVSYALSAAVGAGVGTCRSK